MKIEIERTSRLLIPPRFYARVILLTSFLALLVLSSPVGSFAARKERLIDGWRPVHYSVELTLDDQLTTITSARAKITVLILKDQLTAIDLDFGDLTVDSASINNAAVEFEHSAGRLDLKLPRKPAKGTRIFVSITYHGKPKDGLILTSDKDGVPSAVGDNWPDRLHHWIPCLDHPSAKATVDFSVTTSNRNLVVANGRLNRIQAKSNSTRTWVYSEGVPIPPYCMIIAVGEFAKIQPAKTAVTELTYYVPKSDQSFAMQGFSPAIPSLKLFSQVVAPYPYEKLALIIGATRFGGMENSSAIVFTTTLFNQKTESESQSPTFKISPRIVNLIAHEVAHQWFGDSVTESTWADLWLSEGFATYFAGVFIQKYEGEQAFRNYMKQTAETYFRYAQNNRTPIFDDETEQLTRLLNANNYQKGAWVLHMLRSALGDKVFFQGVRAYYQKHKSSTASTEDLRAALEKASRADLRRFFKSWIYGAGHPHYELTWEWNRERQVVKLRLKQLQPEPAFPNPVPIDVITTRGRRRLVLRPGSKDTVREVRLGSAPIKVELDPNSDILKEVSTQMPVGVARGQSLGLGEPDHFPFAIFHLPLVDSTWKCNAHSGYRDEFVDREGAKKGATNLQAYVLHFEVESTNGKWKMENGK